MQELRAGLVRQQHEIFGAATIGINVFDPLQSELVDAVEAKIRDFDAGDFDYIEKRRTER